jgi:uncharacterized membrane protein YebE (DUF533 family)
MLRKLITLAITTGLAKKAYAAYKEKQARDEQQTLDDIAAQIKPQAGERTGRKPARKGAGRGSRSRSEAPDAG